MKDDKLKIILGAILIIIGINAVIFKNNYSSRVTEDSKKFKKEYESINNTIREKDGKTIRSISIPSNNPMVYETAENIAKKMDNKETFLVYFGFNDCPWCRSVIETLIETAKEEGITKIYYVDVKEIRDIYELNEEGLPEKTKEGSTGYNKLIDKMSNVLSQYTLTTEDEDVVKLPESRIYAPNVVAVVKGKSKKMVTGISDNEKDPYMKLTDKIKKDSKNDFKKVIKYVK